jgi:P-type Ca2+ transporter type 2C
VLLRVTKYGDWQLILAFIAANLIVGFFHEYRAELAMNNLKECSDGPATVVRHRINGPEVISIPASTVAIGDIVKLDAGQVVPADIRLFRTDNLQIDESLLTGESLSILKDAEALPLEEPRIGDCLNLTYSGTIVTRGVGYGVVYAVGMATESGKIAKTLKPDTSTPNRSYFRKLFLVLKMISGLYNTTVLQKKSTSLLRIRLTLGLQNWHIFYLYRQ